MIIAVHYRTGLPVRKYHRKVAEVAVAALEDAGWEVLFVYYSMLHDIFIFGRKGDLLLEIRIEARVLPKEEAVFADIIHGIIYRLTMPSIFLPHPSVTPDVSYPCVYCYGDIEHYELRPDELGLKLKSFVERLEKEMAEGNVLESTIQTTMCFLASIAAPELIYKKEWAIGVLVVIMNALRL